MLFRLFLLFTIIPVLEIWLLIRVGRVIGALPTVAVLVLVSLVGAWLARTQGVRVLIDIQRDLAEGRLPAARLLDGAMILADPRVLHRFSRSLLPLSPDALPDQVRCPSLGRAGVAAGNHHRR